jgi:hypothetical protein
MFAAEFRDNDEGNATNGTGSKGSGSGSKAS